MTTPVDDAPSRSALLVENEALKQALWDLRDAFEPVTFNTREELLSGTQVLAMRRVDALIGKAKR